MLVVELIHEMIGNDWQLPPHIKSWSEEKKLKWLLHALAPVVEHLYQVYGGASEISIAREEEEDELCKSSLGFVRACMDFFVLDDIIKSGDVCRLPAIIKRLAPLFIGLTSFNSKYAVEGLNKATKLTWVLSEREGVKVMLRAFVNTSAKAGHNKPADMQQEINIRTVKTVIKGIGAGKTPAAILRASKAAPAINRMAAGFQEGSDIVVPSSIFSHHKKPRVEDANTLRQLFQTERPFSYTPGRCVNLDVSSCVLANVSLEKFILFAMRNAERAISQYDFELESDL